MLRNAIHGCYQVQDLTRPLIDHGKYQKGMQFEQTLSTLMDTVMDQPGCGQLQSELKVLDGLVFQLKYMCMAPMLPALEEIQSHVSRYVATLQEQPESVEYDQDDEEEEKEQQEETEEEELQDQTASSTLEAPCVSETLVWYDERKGADDESSTASLSSVDRHVEEETPPLQDATEETTDGVLSCSSPVSTRRLSKADNSNGNLDFIIPTTVTETEEKPQRSPDPPLDRMAIGDRVDHPSAVSGEPAQVQEDEWSFAKDISNITFTIKQEEAQAQNKQKEFFDRLHHLFEVREKVDMRMQKIDPSGKLTNIEQVVHSKGIQNTDGSYKLEYQQRDIRGNVIQNLGEVYKAAEQAKNSFVELVYGAVDKTKGLDRYSSHFPPLMARDRAAEKCKYLNACGCPAPAEAWLYDILRATITCGSVKQMISLNNYFTENAHIVQAKNRFAIPKFNGYRDLLYHVRVPYGYRTGVYFVAQIQIQHKETIAMDKLLGLNSHRLYFRSCFEEPERSVDKTLQSLEALDKAGAMDETFMAALLQSKDVDQLLVFAKLLHETLECHGDAVRIFSHALMNEKENNPEPNARLASIYRDIGLVRGKHGDAIHAIEDLREALALQEIVFGPMHPEIATTRTHLGQVISICTDDQAALEEALQQNRKALEIRLKSLGKDHIDVAASYQNIGLTLGQLERTEESLEAYRQALTILTGALGPEHASVASTYSMIGSAHYAEGNFTEARKAFEDTLEIRRRALGRNHGETADANMELANVLCQIGDLGGAEARYREALRIRGIVLGRNHPDYATVLTCIGHILSINGDFEGAEKMHRKALSIREEVFGKNHPASVSSRRCIQAASNHEPTG